MVASDRQRRRRPGRAPRPVAARGAARHRALWLLLAAAALGAWLALREPAAPQRTGPSIEELAQQRAARKAGSVHDRVIPDSDLPPPGTRSLFDHLLAENGGLPYPFEKLVALVESYDDEGRQPVQVLIPDGRSLLKAQADFHRPRVLYAADFQAGNSEAMLGIAPRGRLFLGFVEDAAEIEVISYNELAGRFEFQLVKDYREGGIPRIVYARRAVCTTCHQGAAPIFPERPWSETNGQPQIAARIAEARGSEAPYHGVALRQPLAAPERFDELTNVGNFIPVAQRLWLDGCTDAACRQAMLRAALAWLWNPGEFDTEGPLAQALRAAQANGFPAGGIPVPEADLPNRDPLAGPTGWRALWQRLFGGDPAPRAGPRSNDDLAAFEELPPLPPLLDPLTPRPPERIIGPQDLDGAWGIAALFTRTDVAMLEQAAGWQLERLLAAVDALDPALFGERPFSRVRTMQALLAALGRPVPGYCCDDVTALSEPVALGEPELELAPDSPLIPYRDYCFACHRGNPARRLDFMAGDTEAEVLARIQDTPKIRDVLDWQRYRGTAREGMLMPPADSPQRAAMEQGIAEGRLSLEQMRDVVPSLFDF